MLSTKDPSQLAQEVGERFPPTAEELVKCFSKLKMMSNDHQVSKITNADICKFAASELAQQVGERFISPTEEEPMNHFKNLKMLGNDHQVCKIPNIEIRKFAPLELVQDVGMRFHPTDEELVNHYLKLKLLGNDHQVEGIPEVDIYKFEPWDLPQLSGIKSDKDWYFFCPRHYKYANSMRTNRTTKAGYWKITGKDWEIKTRLTNKEIGRKRCLVFYVRGPKSSRTQWIMHEYSATFNLPNQEAFVLCKLKKLPDRKTDDSHCDESSLRMTFASKSHVASDTIPQEVDLEVLQYVEPFLGFTLESDFHTQQVISYINGFNP